MFKVLILFFISMSAFAENTYRFEVYGSSTNQDWNESSPFNPNNSVLKEPEWAHTLELRPDMQFNLSENQSVVLRSRHFAQMFQTDYTNPDRTRYHNEGHSDLTDLFASSTWNSSLSTTIGLQNYQWGPAEIFSPSNPFFHFTNDQRSFFYKEKGRGLIRANWNPNPETTNWSVVAMYEPLNNKTRYWIADKDFHPRSAVKVEYQFANPANAVALLAGQGDDQHSFVGEYMTWSPVEGYSVYGDLQHHPGRTNYVPKKNQFGLYDMVDSDENDRIYTMAIVGFRWEGRADFRQEFIYNEMGYNSNEWREARSSAVTLSPNLSQNSERFSAPGLEFRTQAYSYSSLRIPDLGHSKKASVSIRWLSALLANSSALQLNYEYDWNDSAVLSAECIQFLGAADGEFRAVSNRQASLGFRWTY
jgi:hypothetical protein